MKKLLVLFMLIVLTLSGCSTSNNTTKDNTTDDNTATSEEVNSVDKVMFTYVTSPLNVPSIIEKNKEIFKSNLDGIKVEYSEITSGADQTQALASGDIQILYAVGGSSVILSAASGADIKILNMYSRAPEAFCLYTKDDSLTSPASLKGKKIAGPMGTNLHELLVSYLKSDDMSIDDVEFLNMSIPDALAAMENGSIDVALLGGPAAYSADKAGLHKIADGKGYIDAIIAVATTNKFYDEHKDVIDKITKAQQEIITFMNENSEETKKIVMEALEIDEEAFDTMYPQYDFSLEVSQEDKDGLQRTADFMLENNMIEKAVDTSTLFIEK